MLAAILCVAVLGALVVAQRTGRLRDGYQAFRLADEVGRLENELRWLAGERDALLLPEALRVRSGRIGLDTRYGGQSVVVAPPPGKAEAGQ